MCHCCWANTISVALENNGTYTSSCQARRNNRFISFRPSPYSITVPSYIEPIFLLKEREREKTLAIYKHKNAIYTIRITHSTISLQRIFFFKKKKKNIGSIFVIRKTYPTSWSSTAFKSGNC